MLGLEYQGNKTDNSSEKQHMSSSNIVNSVNSLEKALVDNINNDEKHNYTISNSTKFIQIPKPELDNVNRSKPRMSLALPNNFKITTKFEWTTIHEQNLSDAIEAIQSSDFDTNCTNRFALKQSIDDLCDQYPYEALDYIDKTRVSENDKSRSKIDFIIDFDSKVFFYKNDLNHKINLITKYNTDEIEFKPNTAKRSRRYSGINRGIKEKLAGKSVSIPYNENYKITMENCVGNDVMHPTPFLLVNKVKLDKNLTVIKIWGKNYEIGLLNSDIRYGSIIISNRQKESLLSEVASSSLNQKDSRISKVYTKLKTGAKMHQIQLSRSLKNISLDRESIFNKLMSNHDNIIVQKTIEEEEIEDIESKRYTELITNNSQFGQDPHMTKIDKYLLNEDSEAKISDFSETENYPGKDPKNDYHSISMTKQASSDFSDTVVKRRKTQSAFYNKFFMALRIDNEKKDK